MSEKIKPALSAEEWATRRVMPDYESNYPLIEVIGDELHYDNSAGEYSCTPVSAQKVAALCLYGQPYGFTQEDVSAVRSLAAVCVAMGAWKEHPKQREALLTLHARIAALLPPPSQEPR